MTTVTEPSLEVRAVWWLTAIGILALGIAVLANLARLEFGPWRAEPIALDEAYFSVCAVRSMDEAQVPSTGCKDNKAPLIFLVHQGIQSLGSSEPYDLGAIKAAAAALTLGLIALTALLAARLAGALAATMAAGLAALTLGADAEWLALKTEAVGSVFMLMGLFALTGDWRRSAWAWLVAGLGFGIAMCSKQTFVFPAVAVLAWGLWDAWRGSATARRQVAFGRLCSFGAGASVPFLVFLGLFWWQGRHLEFLASLLLYPTLYAAPAPEGLGLQRQFWRAAALLTDLGKAPLTTALFAASAAWALQPRPREASGMHPAQPNVIVFAALMVLLFALLAPIYFSPYLVPAWLLMAVVGGWGFATLPTTALKLPLAGACLALALSSAAMAWATDHSRRSIPTTSSQTSLPKVPGPGYAFQIGGNPRFYFDNGLIPASDIGFAWALPGTLERWNYKPLDTSTWRGRLLAAAQARNFLKLRKDFERTPPRYILTTGEEWKTDGAPGWLGRYVDDLCQPKGPPSAGESMRIHVCDPASTR